MSYEMTDFQTDILEASMAQPVVVDFWAPWCGPCRNLGPVLEKMAAEDSRWKLVKINVDEHQAVAAQFQIQSIPMVYMVHEGKVVDGFNGAMPESEIQKWLAPHLGDPEPAEEDPAEAMLAAGNEAQAIAALKQQIEEKPEDEGLKMKLAALIVFQQPGEAMALLEGIEIGSKHRDRAEKLTMLAENLAQNEKDLPKHPHCRDYLAQALKALHARDYQETLDQFLEVLYRDKTYHEGAARKGIIGLFEYLGKDHELTRGYSRRFEMAMF